MYAIKVYEKRPRKLGLKTKDDYFLSSEVQKNYYLMRDLTDNIVHVYTRKEKAQKIVDQLQQQNPKMLIQLTEEIPAAALTRALNKKQQASE